MLTGYQMPFFVWPVITCNYFRCKCILFYLLIFFFCCCLKTAMDQQWLNDLLFLTCNEVFYAADKWYGSGCSSDIIAAHWLRAVVCVQFFFVCFFFSLLPSLISESTVLDGRFCRWQGTPWHGDSPYATCTLLNAKESNGCETYSFWFKFQREVCVYVCVCVCVWVCVCACVFKLKRYVWNRVEDNCPFPLKIIQPDSLKACYWDVAFCILW